ncbi:carboxypeptidase regulatory-like domain-containing protein [Dysgonomonas sp. OttesenSCG-928-M03]|nr:carboxypeptidase regulatory-like domain-containing protein [Dysgonomonas sp. OttesenSCG-928-M03]
MKRIIFLLVMALIGINSFISAQVTTSTLSGRVEGADEPLIGATVTAVHEPSGTRYGVITNMDGRYTIQGMRTGGPYTIEVSFLGFNKYVVKDVTLQLGETTVINATMQESTSTNLGEVIVIGNTSKFAGEKKGATTNISNAQITTLPTISRSINDFTRLSPYSGGGSSFAGRDGRMNNITIDGANFNNNFGIGGNLPGGRAQPISLDAIDEVQVTIAPYDVRQANFTGAGINAITKSGTNTFKGTAYTYQRNENMNGTWVNREQIEGLKKSSMETYGASVGGPIIKNKLFFFVNGEFESSPEEITNWKTSEDGKSNKAKFLSRTSTADMQTVSDYLKDKYNYNTGGFNNYPGEVKNHKILARLDWNINEAHKLTLRYNYVKSTNDQIVNRSSTAGTRAASDRMGENSMAFANTNYMFENIVKSWTMELKSNLSSKISNQLLGTYTKTSDMRDSNSDIFPMIDIWKDNDAYISAGYELFSYNNGVKNDTYMITDNLTLYLGKHNITAGLSYEYQNVSNAFMRFGTGYYKYASLDDFLSNSAPLAYALTYGYGGKKNPSSELDFAQFSAYVQDQFSPIQNLSITGGIRLDLPMYVNDLDENKAISAVTFADGVKINTGEWPSTKLLVSPRVGFNWDIKGDKSVVLRGGSGIFTGRIPFVFFTNMPTNSGMLQNTVTISDPAELSQIKLMKDQSEIMALFPNKFPQQPAEQVPGSIASIDKDFKLPQVWKNNLAIDYQVPTSFPFSLTFEAMYSKDINQIVQKNVNMISLSDSKMDKFAGPDTRYKYPKTYKESGKTIYPYRVYNNVSEAMVLQNTSKGYSYSLSLMGNIEPVNNLRLMMAYTYTASKDVSGNPGDQAASAWSGTPSVNGPNELVLNNSQYRTPHKIVASVNYNIDWNKYHGTSFGLFYSGYNGGGTYPTFSYGYNNDMNGDGVNGDLIYIPKTKDELTFVDKNGFTAAEQSEAFWNYINQDNYLKNHKGEYAKSFGAMYPWYHRVDLKLVESYHFYVGKRKNTVQLSLDIFNIPNLISSKWGVMKQTTLNTSSGLTRILNYEGVNEDNVPKYSMVTTTKDGDKILPTETFQPTRSQASTWSMQVGIRYIF